MKKIEIQIEDGHIAVNLDKTITAIEALGIFRYLEKRIWATMYNPENDELNHKTDVPTRSETTEEGKKETPAPKKAKRPQGKG